MRPQLRIVAVVATVLLFHAGRSFAGDHQFVPHSVFVAKANVSHTGTAALDCETRFFDRFRNVEPPGVYPPACYGPGAIRAAYGLSTMIDAGYDGKGRTIVILAAYGSPTAKADLQRFDAAFGLPDPPSFEVVTMTGTPAFSADNGDQGMWAQETSLDVQWGHAIAPGAKIVVVATASNSAGDLLAGLSYAIDKRLGEVISISFGQSEAFLNDAAGAQIIEAWEQAFKRARQRHITVLAAAGDQGSTNTADEFGDVFGFQNVNYPASSPNVTAVGGTNLFFGTTDHADPYGKYLGETVWNDQPQGIMLAGGGGVSALFERPQYQATLPAATRKILQRHRGIPDVAFNAGLVGGVPVYLGFTDAPGFAIIGGTSAGAAQWAGVIADLNQAVGRPLGFLNNRLYKVGLLGMLERDERRWGARGKLFHDITVGDNSFTGYDPEWNEVSVPGFSATKGWDLATGWGTPNFGVLAALFDCADDDDDRN